MNSDEMTSDDDSVNNDFDDSSVANDMTSCDDSDFSDMSTENDRGMLHVYHDIS